MLEVRAPLDVAGVGVALAEEGFEERGFAGAVGADDADALAALHVELELLPELLGAERLGEFPDLEHLVAGALVGVEREVDLLVGLRPR